MKIELGSIVIMERDPEIQYLVMKVEDGMVWLFDMSSKEDSEVDGIKVPISKFNHYIKKGRVNIYHKGTKLDPEIIEA